MNICVFGSSDELSFKCIEAAKKLGRYIGINNHTLVYGGFDDGLLGIVAHEAKDNGADIISVLPITPRKNYQEFKYSTIIYKDNDKRIRKKLQFDNADIFIVMPEGLGVLDELFEVLLLKQYGEHNKKIFIVNIENRFDSLISLLDELKCNDLYSVITKEEFYKIDK